MSPLPYSRGRDVRNAYHEIIGSYETFVTLFAPPAPAYFCAKLIAFALHSSGHSF